MIIKSRKDLEAEINTLRTSIKNQIITFFDQTDDICKLIMALKFIPNELFNNLDFNYCRIQSLDHFKNFSHTYLKILTLSNNAIEKIIILTKCKFPLLEHLFLNGNKIKDINPLKDMRFPQLTVLGLSMNLINSIEVLPQTKIPKLTYITLSQVGNQINNIEPLERVNFPVLERIYLSNNQIDSIESFSKINFLQLVYLNLDYNKFTNFASFFCRTKLPNLLRISCQQNKEIKSFQSSRFGNILSIRFPKLTNNLWQQ